VPIAANVFGYAVLLTAEPSYAIHPVGAVEPINGCANPAGSTKSRIASIAASFVTPPCTSAKLSAAATDVATGSSVILIPVAITIPLPVV
jgi:hypothetical protein